MSNQLYRSRRAVRRWRHAVGCRAAVWHVSLSSIRNTWAAQLFRRNEQLLGAVTSRDVHISRVSTQSINRTAGWGYDVVWFEVMSL